MPLAELEEKRIFRANTLERMREILKGEKDGKLSPADAHEFEELEAHFDNLTASIEREERAKGLGSGGLARGDVSRAGGLSGEMRAVITPETHPGISERDPTRLTREQRTRDWASERLDPSGFTAADVDQFSLGRVMRAAVDPKFRDELNDVEKRVLAEGTNSAGGFWVPEILSTKIIDRIRKAMTVLRAGATTVPLESDEQSLPRLAGGVTGAWRAENAAFTETDATFERVTFRPKSYGFVVRTSEELYQDMVPGGHDVLENEFAQAAALEIDRVALRGSGVAPQPTGVRNQTGVTLQSLGANGATPTRYADLVTAITTLQTANRNPNGVILAPRTSGFFAGLADTTNQPLRAPRVVEELPFYVTGQVPVDLTQGTSNDTSEVYVGYWPDLLIGVRLGIELRLLRERYADVGQFAWRLHTRLDAQLAHPESFVVITGVRP